MKRGKPRLLDLFCGAGGAAVGYARAGFEVVGVDIEPQPNYPFRFHRGNALIAMPANLGAFDAIHASPPCQAYTSLRQLGKGAGEDAPDLVSAVRDLLLETGLPYVIENVVGAPLRNPVRLCGSSFGLKVWRHRLFETNWPLLVPPCSHPLSAEPIAVYGDHPQESDRAPRRARTLEEGQEAMGIDWMPWKPLTQAIPPAMTEHIGIALLSHLQTREKTAA